MVDVRAPMPAAGEAANPLAVHPRERRRELYAPGFPFGEDDASGPVFFAMVIRSVAPTLALRMPRARRES
jgi:hypothetical protein